MIFLRGSEVLSIDLRRSQLRLMRQRPRGRRWWRW